VRPDPPEPFVVSAATEQDAAEVTELIRAVELAQDGVIETTVADVTTDWEGSDLGGDVVLVREEGRLVAYGHVASFRRGALADGYVHPSETGRGLGRYLVRTLEARGRELAPRGPKLETGVSVTDAAGRRLMEEEGFVGVRQWLRMLVDLESPPPVQDVPGVAIRRLRGGEEGAFHEVFERSFAGHWGHVRTRSSDAWWEEVERESGGDRAYYFVAERDGRLIGETSGRPKRFGMGWISSIGVVPEERGRGIGRALLLRSLAEFWSRGERRVGLAVDAANETGATRLYESVGMGIAFGSITYEKDISTGTVTT
jgi:mycothiol synthase